MIGEAENTGWGVFLSTVTKFSMLLCTTLVAVLTWNASRVIDQVDAQAKRQEMMMQHILETDGKVQSLQTMTANETASIQQLQNAVFFRGRK